eukprot:UN03630
MSEYLSISKKLILTYGYVREIECECRLSNVIPPEIKAMVYSFHKYCDTWNTDYIVPEAIELIPNENSIKALQNETHSAYADHVIESGIHTWRLKIIKNDFPKTYHQQPFIGILPDQPELLKKFQSSLKWFYDGGYIYCGGSKTIAASNHGDQNYYSSSSEYYFRYSGDIMDYTVNLKNLTIKYIRQSKKAHHTFSQNS